MVSPSPFRLRVSLLPVQAETGWQDKASLAKPARCLCSLIALVRNGGLVKLANNI
jgi:hypothetical protein